MTSTQQPSAYAASGVSIEAGDRAVELMKEWVDKARRPEVVGGIGGFAGLFDATALKDYRRPLLATSADGVGTKVQIAQRMDVHDTIGYDLVGMLVDDLVDSRWTMAVASRELRLAGADAVLPFALGSVG